MLAFFCQTSKVKTNRTISFEYNFLSGENFSDALKKQKESINQALISLHDRLDEPTLLVGNVLSRDWIVNCWLHGRFDWIGILEMNLAASPNHLPMHPVKAVKYHQSEDQLKYQVLKIKLYYWGDFKLEVWIFHL